MKFNSEILRQAWKNFKNGVPTWAEAIRQAIKMAKAFIKGLVTFFKVPKKDDDEVEITTRRIGKLSDYGYVSMGSDGSSGSTIKVVDLDKYEATRELSKSIISFHLWQII